MTILDALGFSFALLLAGCWIGNVVKLVNCDFEAPYKGEVIHMIGLIPAVSLVTVWFDDK